MAKYDEQFKLKVVQQYLSGGKGFKEVARQYGVAHSSVCQWVAGYQAHGAKALSKKRGRYSARFKLSVLQCKWQEGLSQRQTAARFNLRSSTRVGVWERQYDNGGLDALAPRPQGHRIKMPHRPPPKLIPTAPPGARTLEQVLEENEYLRAENAYLKKLEALIQAKKAAQKKRA